MRLSLGQVILLGVQVNPDGMELISNWYMREPTPCGGVQGTSLSRTRSMRGTTIIVISTCPLAETTNINQVLFDEWFPQIVYDHHQTGPSGTVMFAPPFRGPPNHNLDPLILTGLDASGAAMHGRFVLEGPAGRTPRGGTVPADDAPTSRT